MIPRYSRKQMTDIWEEKNRFEIWVKIEISALEAMEELGTVPKGTAEKVDQNAKFDVDRINEIEKEIKHDVLAFLTNLAENVGPESRFIHQGMTSSDVIDTCLNIQLKQSGEILLSGLDSLLKSLRARAIEHKNTICMGRSHGIHAEPTTFGLKMLQAFEEFNRNRNRLLSAINEISTCSISGSVGTFANVDPYVEDYVAKKLDLNVEPISTQIIPRDRHATFFSVLGIIASSIERLATEIRHLQRSEVMEVAEYFSKKQKGSSSMPHKRNPILTENLSGLARIVRSSVIPALENISLWHERDISHSSVERMIAPDATVTLDFAINRLINVIDELVVYPDQMLKNLNQFGGLVFSQRLLLILTQKDISREESYKVVQKNAMLAWDSYGTDKPLIFEELVKKDKFITSTLTKKEIEDIFDLKYHTKNIDNIFARVLEK